MVSFTLQTHFWRHGDFDRRYGGRNGLLDRHKLFLADYLRTHDTYRIGDLTIKMHEQWPNEVCPKEAVVTNYVKNYRKRALKDNCLLWALEHGMLL